MAGHPIPTRLSLEEAVMLRKYMKEVRSNALAPEKEVQPFNIPTKTFADLLCQANSELSAHSINRGTLQYLMLMGVPEKQLMRLAKHQDLKQLRRCLDPTEVAKASPLRQATRFL